MRVTLAVALGGLAALASLRALEPTEWKNRQPLSVESAGLVKLALPPETLGLARAGLEDLRLLDPAGREVPFVFTLPAPAVPALTRTPRVFQTTLANSTTELLIGTDTTTPLESLTLTTPAPAFLKAARLDLSNDGEQWETLAEGAVLFRQFGAEQLRFDLKRRTASHLRVRIDDSRSRTVPFTGATLHLAGSTPPEVTTPITVRVVRREEFAGESVLTLDLGGANVPLASLEFATAESLFARTLTFATRELRDETAVERTLATGSIWRVAAEGVPATARLDVPLHLVTPSRELLVHLTNGDSPPLAIDGVTARQRPRWLVFRAAEPGTYAVLTGHAQIAAPRYDLASLATALRDTPPTGLIPGPAAPNPGYHTVDTLADTPLRGAAIDPAAWGFRKPVQLTAAGVQQLELDLDVLARAQSSFADLRLVRDGAQVPYLLERPALSRSRPLAITRDDDPKQPRLSRWQIKLPRASLPITRLTLTSSTALFQRHLRLFEKISDDRRGEMVERTLADADWSHTPGDARSLTLGFSSPPATDTFSLETDNGDNPPIVLASASAAYPVARLLFKTEPIPNALAENLSNPPAVSSSNPSNGPGSLALYYGQRSASAPRYDLSLVAGQILAAEKSVASLGAEEQARAAGWSGQPLAGARGDVVFWSVLALVVVGLLAIVAKLLPKPPSATG